MTSEGRRYARIGAGSWLGGRIRPDVVAGVVAAVTTDLRTGSWDRRYGHLRKLPAYGARLRLVVNQPA